MINKIKIFKNKSFKDHRGYYWTSWKKGEIKKVYFKHAKFSLSKKNVLRGLHGDSKTWKLISCPYGKFLLVHQFALGTVCESEIVFTCLCKRKKSSTC